MAPVRDRNENWPSTPRRRKNRTIRRRMKRQRAVASRAAFDRAGCPLKRAARAALAALAHRRTAGAPAAPVPPPGAAAETAAPVATAALGESAAFSVALSSAAWPPSPPVPLAVVPPVPRPAPPPAPVPAEGAAEREVLASDTPAITPPPASSTARAIPTVQRQALRWSVGAGACGPGCQGYPYPGP